MLLLYVYVVLTIASSAWAGNGINTTTASQSQARQGWTPEPNCASGTASIIWQCLSTIALCTYTAVHLNVPPAQLSNTASLGRKLLAVIFGIIAPEMWAWCAASELLVAREIVKRCKLLGEPISLKQAFFICSGGIKIRALHTIVPSFEPIGLEDRPVTVHSGSVYFRRWQEKRVVDIADDEVRFFAQNVPPEEVIDDKSKADTLMKTITSLQALWTFVQIVARGQQFGAAAIPLLQVTTLGYVAVAAFTYGCWWYKPYDISTAHVVDAHVALKDGKLQINPDKWRCGSTENTKPTSRFLSLFPCVRFFLARQPQLARMVMAGANDVSNHILTLDMILFGALTVIFAALHCIA